jgi:hypothetical protein
MKWPEAGWAAKRRLCLKPSRLPEISSNLIICRHCPSRYLNLLPNNPALKSHTSMGDATVLKLQDRSQAFIDGSLQTWRERAGIFGQKTSVQGQKLRNIHN